LAPGQRILNADTGNVVATIESADVESERKNSIILGLDNGQTFAVTVFARSKPSIPT